MNRHMQYNARYIEAGENRFLLTSVTVHITIGTYYCRIIMSVNLLATMVLHGCGVSVRLRRGMLHGIYKKISRG